jgi:hypothetical protein
MSPRYQFIGTFPTVVMEAVHGVETAVKRALTELDSAPRPVDEPGTTVLLETGDEITLPEDTIVSPDLFKPVESVSSGKKAAVKAETTQAAAAAAITKENV